MEATPSKMITLKSSDEQIFLVEESTITSNILAEVIEYYNKHPEVATGEAKMTTLESFDEQNLLTEETTITGNILAKVMDYCNKHAEVATSDEDKKIWDEEFVNFDFGTNTQMFLDMYRAAKFLNIKGLMDLISNIMAKWMTGKPPDDILQAFNLTDEEFQMTPEEDEDINRKLEIISRRRNVGAFE
ncbi:SKP1-like protein 1A [Papaver somniferum]|uniref:SKP1-like protein 1A n=1 Tax=Papaver somniferum TaxID=3469 RepID=UPI000E6FFDE4|nr:SKP1-like protein 1A [Papaver somniferum]